MTPKDLYRTLCAEEKEMPVFLRDWWLDAACGDDWDVLLYEKNGKLLAAMPLFVPCKRLITMPHYTQMMGVWFVDNPSETKYASLLAHRQTISTYFVKELERYRSFFQNFNYGFDDWLPFYWGGYSQTTRYSYILHDIRDFEAKWNEMSQQTRRNINTAKNAKIQVRTGVSVEDFLYVQALTFKRQQLKNKQSNAVLRHLIETARERGQGELFGGYDDAGNLHAVAFIVWQDSMAYYIAGGGNPSLRHSGAHSLVMWEAIQAVSHYTNRFDFEGSMLPGVERFFREFGAVQTAYFNIKRGKPSLADRVRMKLKNR